MADFHPMEYAEQHPYVTAGVIIGGGLLLMWWFGFFGGGQQNNTAATTEQNLAAAYYSAEAAQTVSGTQLQIATVNDAAATNIAGLQYGATTAVANSNDNAATAIAANMYGSQVQLGQIAGNTQVAEANDAAATGNTGTYYNYLNNLAANAASEYNTYQTAVVPYEVASRANIAANIAGTPFSTTEGYGLVPGSPSYLQAIGYPANQALALATVP